MGHILERRSTVVLALTNHLNISGNILKHSKMF